MKSMHTRWMGVVGLGLALGVAGCSDDGHDDHDDHDHDAAVVDAGPVDAPLADAGSGETLTIPFRAVVGTEPFQCGRVYTGLGSQMSRWNPLDFRFYVHDLRLVTPGGEVPLTVVDEEIWQRDGAALLDFEDRTGQCSNGTAPTNTSVRVRLPAGASATGATGLRFTLGLPFAINHRNASTSPSPFNLTSMWWNWQGGYKFLRVDGRIEDAMGAPVVASWNIHLGSTGCDGNAMGNVTTCTQPNRVAVSLEGFNPARSVVLADLAALVQGADLSRSQMPAAGCMSGADDPDCPPIFTALGLRGAGAQQLFRTGE